LEEVNWGREIWGENSFGLNFLSWGKRVFNLGGFFHGRIPTKGFLLPLKEERERAFLSRGDRKGNFPGKGLWVYLFLQRFFARKKTYKGGAHPWGPFFLYPGCFGGPFFTPAGFLPPQKLSP